MTMERAFWLFWIGGIVAFGVTIMLGLPLNIPEVPGGILDHQAAATATEVDRIQRAWTDAGQAGTARIAMISDLCFIGIFGIGSFLGGVRLRKSGGTILTSLGFVAILSAVVFVVTDYTETISQFIQLSAMRGDDSLAGLAATVRPIKIVAFLVTFFAVLLGLILKRRVRPTA